MIRLGKAVTILAMVLVTGSHWAVLQSVAWTRMLANNLRTTSLAEAVEKTFDGQHPCCLCKAIAAGKKAAPKQVFTSPTQKSEFPPLEEDFVLSTPVLSALVPVLRLAPLSLPQEPPDPPPRVRPLV